ncbi:MAG: DUF2459 domain-containing protein [Melioribacteraceae bacterium]
MKSILSLIISFYITVEIIGGEYSFDNSQDTSSTYITIHLINYSWHTGLLFPVNETTIKKIPAIKYFENYDYVDISWGDEEFYQHPDFNLYLGAKAILYPTPSVVRVEGYNLEMKFIIDRTEFAIQFQITEANFNKLADFINNSFLLIDKNDYKVTSKQRDGKVVFYSSHLKYHLMNTCNTWVARAFNSAGFQIEPTGIITDNQLFTKIRKFGKVLKNIKK